MQNFIEIGRTVSTPGQVEKLRTNPYSPSTHSGVDPEGTAARRGLGAVQGAEAETPKTSKRWEMGRYFWLGVVDYGSVERRELPQRGPGRSPAENRF